MRLTVVGAGSTYTPELVEGLAARRDVLPVDELVLTDTDAVRLELLAALAQRMLVAVGCPTRVVVEANLDDAVRGAHAVFVQIRVGGQAARLGDETAYARFGLLGQETTGVGGFAKALRTVPVVLDIADRVRAHADPGAWLVDFTNPVGIVTRALLGAGHRAVGLCNFAIGIERRIALLLGVEPRSVRVTPVGLNHLSWVRSVEVDGVERLSELLDGHGAELAAQMGLDVELFRALGAIPSYYLRYYYDRDAAVAEQLVQPPRAAVVVDLEARLLTAYADPALDRKPALLEGRGGAYYSEAAADLVTSLLTGDGRRQVVDASNRAAVPGLRDDDVVEVPFRVDRDGAHPLPLAPLAPEMLGLVQAVTAYEELAVEAALTGDRDVARRALLAHPLVAQWRLIDPVLDTLLSTNREHLPQFPADP